MSEDLLIVSTDKIPSVDEIKETSIENLKELYSFCVQMQNLCIAQSGGGLSAVQIGTPWRLFIAIKDVGDLSKFRYFIDCHYQPIGDEVVTSIEGCLSLRNNAGELQRFKINRYKVIRLIGKELLAEDKLVLVDLDEVFENDCAIVYQHEVDHHKGILISDIGDEIHIWS